MNDEFKILIIDDEEVVLDSCKMILAGSRHELETASDGETGLQKLVGFQPDLIFVDLKMPGLSGLEVIEQVQAVDPTIVIVVITGFATVSSAVDAMKRGAYDFLPKPFTPDEFRLITRRGLEKRKLVLETIALKREKELLRENFAAIVSHELKAPIAAVQQNLYVFSAELADQLTEDQKRRFGRMKARIDDLLELINTWLRVFKVDLDSIREQFVPVDVAEVIDKTIASVEPHAKRKNIELVPVVADTLHPVYGEKGTLTEALINLSNNAVKYSHIDSKVYLKADEQEGEIILSVTDTGVGIPEEDLPFLFDDFYRGKSGPTAGNGHGLGLAISRRIIETHDGIDPGGQRPRKRQHFYDQTAGTHKRYTGLTSRTFSCHLLSKENRMNEKTRLLMIDDDPDFTDPIRAILIGAGYEVDVKYNPEDGLKALKEDPPDLLLLDIMMGRGAEGIMIARKLRKDERLREIPVLIITGIREQMAFLFPGEPVHPGFVPVDELVEKPVKPDFLLERVEALLQAAEARKAAAN